MSAGGLSSLDLGPSAADPHLLPVSLAVEEDVALGLHRKSYWENSQPILQIFDDVSKKGETDINSPCPSRRLPPLKDTNSLIIVFCLERCSCHGT